ncbi:hypothetical protein CEXT_693681 [Caerostris extrusa]|uniref:Uncharacterized protein n=1 Tax=Caerostris extrusa TaxID=172846 RepID=A0AAV4XYC8_CAEEX|nr:hypothetical protein CEXT_693681 [Caerostris extrusa]
MATTSQADITENLGLCHCCHVPLDQKNTNLKRDKKVLQQPREKVQQYNTSQSQNQFSTQAVGDGELAGKQFFVPLSSM